VRQLFRSERGSETLFKSVRTALAAAGNDSFRVCEFSVQMDHLHLIIEADGTRAFRGGVRGLVVRLAKAINRALGRRGRVWGDRYHIRLLRTPREVRNALVYVLNNWRKHMHGVGGFDPRSSAASFTGWKSPPPRPVVTSPTPSPHTWLARIGWRIRGLIDPHEAPRRTSS
jgi:putative transposase